MMGESWVRQVPKVSWRIVKAEDVRIESTQSKKQLKVNANDETFAQDLRLAA
jgi:hypothetical protein